MANEIGIIGQMYENRKSKKVGVIESRDEKCKTLMMRDSDGGSFVVTFSTFRSNWRKYEGEQKIETSTQKEEKKEKAKTAEKKLEKKRFKMDIREKLEIIESEKEIIQPIVDKSKCNDLNMKQSAKGGILIKIGRKTIFEVWNDYRNERINVCVREDVKDLLDYSTKTGDVGEEFKETFILKWVLNINKSQLASLVSDLVKAAEKLPVKEKEDK